MLNALAQRYAPISAPMASARFGLMLGLLFGIVAPVLSGFLFPTYVAVLPSPAMNRAMLLELQFVACELLIIGWAFRAGMDRNHIWSSLPIDVKTALVVLLTVMFVSSALISKYPADALTQSLIQVVHLYFAAAVFHLSKCEGAGSEDELLTPLGAGIGLIAIFTAWRFGFPPDPATVPGGKIEWNFAVPGFISVRYMGTWSAAVAAAFAVRLLYRAPSEPVGMYNCYYVLAAAVTIWSGTRAGVLGVSCSVLICILCRGLPQWRVLLMAGLMTCIAIAIALVFQFDDPVFKLFQFGDVADISQFTAGRWELWIATVERWRDSPLLGWGTGAIFYEVDVGWTHTQPHNAVLQFLFSWGLIGAIACCWLFMRFINAAHATTKSNASPWPVLAMVYALLAMSMVDGALYYPRFVSIIVGGLALILARGKYREDDAEPHAVRLGIRPRKAL